MPTPQRRTADWTLKQLLALSRDDLTAAVHRIGGLTGLAVMTIRRRIKSERGTLRVADAFPEWPTQLSSVAPITCARALELGVVPDLAVAANLTSTQAQAALKAASPGRRASVVLQEHLDSQAKRAKRPAPIAGTGAQAQRQTRTPPATTRQPTTQPMTTSPANPAHSYTTPTTVPRSTRQPNTAPLHNSTTLPGPALPARVARRAAVRATGSIIANRFLLDERIGLGGYGEVWRATVVRGRGKGRVCVLKFAAREADARLEEEWALVSRLRHRNICGALEMLDPADAGERVLVFEHGGTSLHDYYGYRAATIDELLDIATQAAAGLQHAHKHQLLHLDLHPANLLRSGEGVIRLIDFGVSRVGNLVESEAGTHQTVAATSAIGWHRQTAAPEAVLGHGVSARSDQFSLAATLALLADPGIRRLPVIPPKYPIAGLNDSFRSVLHRAMNLDRDKRYNSSQAFVAALKRAASLW